MQKLVGAKDSYIRWPFFLEGGIIGLLGSIVPIILLWLVYLSVYGNASNFLATSSLTLLNPNPFLIQLSLILAAIGIVIGSFGSMFSVRRFLKI